MNSRGLTGTVLALAAPGLRAAEAGGGAVSAGQMLQATLALFAVLALIVVLFALLKRVQALPAGGGSLVKVLGGVSLGAKERLLLVQVGEEQILIAASPAGIRKLHKLEQAVEAPPAGRAAGARKGFANVLQSVLEGRRQ